MIARIFLEGLAAISNPQPAQYSSTSFPSPALRVVVGWTVLGPTKFQMLRLMRPFLSFSLLLPGNQSGLELRLQVRAAGPWWSVRVQGGPRRDYPGVL